MSEEIDVKIKFSERVTYAGIVRMTKEQFQKHEAELASKDRRESRRAEKNIANMLDRNNCWQDSDDLEIERFKIS